MNTNRYNILWNRLGIKNVPDEQKEQIAISFSRKFKADLSLSFVEIETITHQEGNENILQRNL